MRRSIAFAAVAAVVSQTEAHDYPFVRSETRVLEDGSSYSYLNDLSSYSTLYGKCVRAKIQDDNDDQQEGNSYFVNGRYHARYKTFASFVLCDIDGSSCGTCDYKTHYVTDLDTYLDSTIASIQEVCQACANQCGRRNLEQEDGGDVTADCNTCASECNLINYGNGGEDETEYMACQAAYADENSGIQYYSGPTCDSNGGLTIGLFYDEDCTVKTGSELDNGFSYDTFKTVENFCGSCSTGMCGDLYPYALHCFGAYNMNANAAEDEDVNSKAVCKAAAEKSNNYKRKHKHHWHIIPVFLVVFSLFGGLTFGSYTYYIRHRDMDAAPMSSEDHHSPSNDYVLS